MAVGEAPGRQEDAQGLAFVGRAGKTLDALLAEQGLDTQRHLLIANVVKCRPPKNRRPTREEATTCLPYLQKQIDLVNPRVIILLGATALKYLAPDYPPGPMNKAAGHFFSLDSYPNRRFMIFYHPAAVLYNRRLAPVMQEHAHRLAHFLREEGLA